MGARGNGAAWASLVAGLASAATLPLAVYVTRFVGPYELLDAAYAIPLGALLGLLALGLSGRARRRGAVQLETQSRDRLVAMGRVLGTLGLCLVGTALISLAVYGLLEYLGSR
jgi:O-antigen/teichoic acid export membrane protein